MKSVGYPKNVVDSAGEVASSPGLINNSYCNLGAGVLNFFDNNSSKCQILWTLPKIGKVD